MLENSAFRSTAALLGPAVVLLLLTGAGAACAAPEAPAGASVDESLGSVSFSTSGDSEARRHFLRGVAALHSFWYPEAAREFQEAQALDPDFAMAYWGEAMAINHPVWDQVDVDSGREVLERLAPTPEARAAKAPTERERAYLAAVELLYDPEVPKEERDRAYAEAMERLAGRFPDDVEASVFHALALEGVVYGGIESDRRFPLLMEAAAILEELFDENPRHPGVLHYLIHAYDDPVHAPLGLRPARIYARVAPAAPHALHMPSHIFVQLGLWDRAAASNVDAWEASVDWVEGQDLSPDRRDFHSLDWLLYARLQQGRWQEAAGTLETAREALAEADDPEGRVAWYRADMEARQRIETGRWSELPADLLEDDSRRAAGPWLAAALAAHHRGDAADAREAADRLAALAGELDEPGPVAVMARQAEGLARLAAGRTEEGLAALTEAAELEEALRPPSGPPDTVKPAHELLGEVLLAHERPEEAAGALERSLQRTPRRALSLLAAARAARALDRSGEALTLYREYLDVRSGADPEVLGLAEAREALGDPEQPE
ncbi:MAG: hypothetical protein ACLF0P_14030 [Thermoanaerobaculia bacterium]